MASPLTPLKQSRELSIPPARVQKALSQNDQISFPTGSPPPLGVRLRSMSVDNLVTRSPTNERVKALSLAIQELLKKKDNALFWKGSGNVLEFEAKLESSALKGSAVSLIHLNLHLRRLLDDLVNEKDFGQVMQLRGYLTNLKATQWYQTSVGRTIGGEDLFLNLETNVEKEATSLLPKDLLDALTNSKVLRGDQAERAVKALQYYAKDFEGFPSEIFKDLRLELTSGIKELNFRSKLRSTEDIQTIVLTGDEDEKERLRFNIGWTITLDEFDEIFEKCIDEEERKKSRENLLGLLQFLGELGEKIMSRNHLLSLAERERKNDKAIQQAALFLFVDPQEKKGIESPKSAGNIRFQESFSKLKTLTKIEKAEYLQKRDFLLSALAHDLRIHYSKLYANVGIPDLRKKVVEKTLTPPLKTAVEFSDGLSAFAVSLTLCHPEGTEKIHARRALKFLVDLVVRLIQDNNYAAAFDLFLGLEHVQVKRLIEAKGFLDKDRIDRYNEIFVLFNETENYKTLRSALHADSPKGNITPLQILFKDLTAIEEGNPSKVDGLYNGEKMELVGDNLKQFNLLKQTLITGQGYMSDAVKTVLETPRPDDKALSMLSHLLQR